MLYGVLGRLRVVHEGAEVPVPGGRQRALLAALVLARGRTVSPQRLVDALWEGDPPAGAAATVQKYVSRLRMALGSEAVVFEPGGYRLVVDPGDLDLVRFDRLADEGASALRGRDTARAERLLRQALELWRGTALEGLAHLPFARPEAIRLEERRLAVEEQLCTALRESGREELGLDPGRRLRDLEELRRSEPALDPPPAAVEAPRPTLALPASSPVLCPVLVGREAEAGVLRTALTEAGRGSGGTVVLVGDPGAGKSRLVREVLGRSERVLEGRAVAGPAPVPFRPLVEALQAGLRRARCPFDVGPYRAALGRLLPEWHDPAAPLSPLPHLAEGVLRLLRCLTGNGPLAVVVEDLHWADDETLGVLEYLADNIAGEQLLLVLTTRADEGPAALRLVSALELRRSARVLRLRPLAEVEVRAMVAACLPDRPSTELVETVVARSHGVPLFVEELLGVADSAGSAVPATFGHAVRARTGALTADQLRVLQAAAVLGHHFDWRLLSPMTGLTNEDVLTALRAATDLQLLQGDGAGLQFRHALHRDAVLSAMFPLERSALAAAALAALRALAPDLPGDACQQAADLAEEAGDAEAAVPLLLDAGRRAANAGALRTAELLLDRALHLASPSARTDVAELLLDVLARAGRCDRALDVGEQLLVRLDHQDDRRRSAGVLVRLAEAATAAADHEKARGYLDRARPHLDDEHVRLRADLAEAECDVAEGHRSAEGRATEAACRAGALGESGLETRALLLVGRCQRERDPDRAEATFARARAQAQAGNDPVGALRALAELGSLDLVRGAPADRVVRAAEEAEALGAVGIAGIARLHAAIAHFIRAERPPGLLRAREAQELAERYALPVISRGARVVEASLHALVGDLDGVAAALDGVPDDDVEWSARTWGNTWAVAFLALERRGDALAALRRARATGGSVGTDQSPLRPLAALLEAIDSGADLYPASPPASWTGRAPRGLVLATAAVLAGRRGDRGAAEESYAEARRLLAPMPWYQHVSARVVAERALADKWGIPGEWLADAEAWLDAHGVPEVAGACRALRPRVAGAGLPLAGALLTPREQEVLHVLATGASNREIAERLVLSPRTVEKHVERLLQKTSTSSRTALAVLAASYAGPRT